MKWYLKGLIHASILSYVITSGLLLYILSSDNVKLRRELDKCSYKRNVTSYRNYH